MRKLGRQTMDLKGVSGPAWNEPLRLPPKIGVAPLFPYPVNKGIPRNANRAARKSTNAPNIGAFF